jgi:Na+/proline symporter
MCLLCPLLGPYKGTTTSWSHRRVMSLLTLDILVLWLGTSFIPIWLLRHQLAIRAQDYFVSSQVTPPNTVKNSFIAGYFRMSNFVPLFVLGANGDFWPVIAGSVFLGLGIYLIFILRRPILAFLVHALAYDESITVHEFIARQHGNNPRVRLLAACLSVVTLLGFIIAEGIAVAMFAQPLLPERTGAAFLLMLGLPIGVTFCVILSGNTGVMQAAQLQLGLLYLGLFASTVLLLYLSVASLTHFPPHATLAVAVIAVCCAALVYYRRSRYVDTTLLSCVDSDIDDATSRCISLGSRLLRRFEKILNVCISIFAVLAIVIALMYLTFVGLPVLAWDSAAALQTRTGTPAITLLAVMLLLLFYPIADMANWQRLAAFEKDSLATNEEPSRQTARLRMIFKTYAVEVPLLWLFICMFGAVAAVSANAPGGAGVPQTFIHSLAVGQNVVATLALSLLFAGVFTMAVSTMSALISACLSTIRYDILPTLRPELMSGHLQWATERAARRGTIFASGAFYLITIIICGLFRRNAFGGSTLLALLFASCGAQLSFVPLIVGPVLARSTNSLASVSSGWAIAILGVGAAAGVGTVAVYFAIGSESYLWAAVPGCLGLGFLIFAVARMRGANSA